MRKIIALILISAMAISLCSCNHEHEMVSATCAEAAHCATCDYTEGEPLEHSKVAATCETAQYCSVCGQTWGSALGHVYKEYKLINYNKAVVEYVDQCEFCGDSVTKSKDYLTKLYSNNRFLLTPAEFRMRYDYILKSEIDMSSTGPLDYDEYLAYAIRSGEEEYSKGIGYYVFFEGTNESYVTSENDKNVIIVNFHFFELGEDELAAAMCALMTVDPTLSYEDAISLFGETVHASSYVYKHNGISYMVLDSDGGFTLTAVLPQK